MIDHTGVGVSDFNRSREAGSRGEVEAFYRAALEAGGRDNGAPGLREDYGPDYFAAYVLDPDGHNIEAVYHGQD
jgi:predicted lactoylglutathione lyase